MEGEAARNAGVDEDDPEGEPSETTRGMPSTDDDDGHDGDAGGVALGAENDGNLEAVLDTDRLDEDALSSLFTERSDEDGADALSSVEDPVLEFGAVFDATGGVGVEASRISMCDAEESMDEHLDLAPQQSLMDAHSGTMREEPTDVSDDQAPASIEAPPLVSIDVSPPQSAPHPPVVPPRPPRPGQGPMTTAETLSSNTDHVNNNRGHQVVTFDVGGKIFRCKAALIRKFPSKRLNQVISCGCEQLGQDTFFIDRNPQHFEMILDWYRTGKYIRHPNVDESIFKEDARYFDLYEEIFGPVTAFVVATSKRIGSPPRNARLTPTASPIGSPHAPPLVPARPRRREVSSSQTSATPTAEPTRVSGDEETVRYARREIKILTSGGLPHVVYIRENEHLVVESVKGNGKLYVRVCDSSGMLAVHVEQAVLYDSRSWFHLQDGRARLQHCILPGKYMYTFWMETHGDPSPAKPKHKGEQRAGSGELEVELRTIYTFRRRDDLLVADEEFMRFLTMPGTGWSGEIHAPVTQPTRSSQGMAQCSCLFLPPQATSQPVIPPQQDSRAKSQLEDDQQHNKHRASIVEQLLSQSNKTMINLKAQPALEEALGTSVPSGAPKTRSTNNVNQQNGGPSTVIKRSGATIALGSKATAPRDPRIHGGERVTVYQQDKVFPSSGDTPRSVVGRGGQSHRNVRG